MSTIKELREKYQNALHAMQTGVSLKMNFEPQETSNKHLRVGVNSAMVDSAALARLLISKGIFTEEEFTSALATEAELEAKRYEDELKQYLGSDVTLG